MANVNVHPQSVRVGIADDHKLVAESLGYALEGGGFRVVGITHSARGAIDLVLREEPDVLLLDIYMPDMSGFEVVSALRQKDSTVRVLILTSSRDLNDVTRAISLDISGYLSKELTSEDLKEAVLMAAAGDRVPDMQLLKAWFFSRSSSGDNDYGLIEDLTEQEFRVLRLMAEGLSNDEIASLLTISINTVKTHVRHIFQKLQVSDRTSAAVWAIRNGMMPFEAVSMNDSA